MEGKAKKQHNGCEERSENETCKLMCTSGKGSHKKDFRPRRKGPTLIEKAGTPDVRDRLGYARQRRKQPETVQLWQRREEIRVRAAGILRPRDADGSLKGRDQGRGHRTRRSSNKERTKFLKQPEVKVGLERRGGHRDDL